MLLLQLFQNPVDVIIFLIAIVTAVSIHEASHAVVADKLGDNTARLLGRTTINPLAHLDPIGSILFLLTGFGWGKPVPVNENRLLRKYDIILVALAGPASNLLLATVLALLFHFITVPAFQHVAEVFIYLNLSLMIFNLIPIPPLDGSKLLRFVISPSAYYALEQYGLIIIIAVFYLTGLGSWLGIAVQGLFNLLTNARFSF